MTLFRRICLSALFISLILGCIIYSKAVYNAVNTALERCVLIIIPSLFAFMAISRMMIRTGAADFIFKMFDKIFQILLGLPKGCAAVFIISNIAGYPVGCSMLKEKIDLGLTDKRSAEAMSIYCYGAGPAFLINAVGAGIFGSTRIGLIIFLSVISANAVLAAIINRIYDLHIEPDRIRSSGSDFSEALVSSVTSAGEDIIKMCSVIVFLSAVIAVNDSYGITNCVSDIFGLSDNSLLIFKSLFEITNINGISRNAYHTLPYLGAVCGFGGLSVIMQIKSVIGKSFNLKLFFKWMPVKMILCFLFTKLYIMLIFDNYIPAFARSYDIIVRIDNLIPSICLIMMIFILLFQKGLDFLKRV